MEVKCGIYKYTNLINGKVYIGQSTNILKRERYHFGSMCNKKDKRYYTYFYSSMRKYGYDNFKFEILELCSKEELNKKERYYIKLYNANNHKFGYNLTDGGVEGEHYTRNIYQIDMNNGNIIRTFNSVKEANDLYKTSNIGFCCKTKKNSIKGYLWRYVDEYDIEEVKETIDKRKHRSKTEKEKINGSYPIGQFTLDGKLVNKFQTKKIANEITNIPISSINKCIYGKRKHAGGYLWKKIGKRGQDISKIN